MMEHDGTPNTLKTSNFFSTTTESYRFRLANSWLGVTVVYLTSSYSSHGDHGDDHDRMLVTLMQTQNLEFWEDRSLTLCKRHGELFQTWHVSVGKLSKTLLKSFWSHTCYQGKTWIKSVWVKIWDQDLRIFAVVMWASNMWSWNLPVAYTRSDPWSLGVSHLFCKTSCCQYWF